MRDSRAETEPAGVPARATQAGEIQGRWSWVEPSVWTERMLTALDTGVKGGKWYSLIDKVSSLRNLKSAFTQVKRNQGSAGVDHVTIGMFEAHLEENLQRLAVSLHEGSYKPQAIRRVWIEKPGSKEKRPLGIPTVRDRVVQAALRNVLEPIFERDFAAQSYGFRPERGTKDALRRVAELLKAGYVHVVDADLQSYFDTIPIQPLLELVRSKVADSKVVELLEAYLGQEVMESAKGWTPERGTPQGAVISPLLSNIYPRPAGAIAWRSSAMRWCATPTTSSSSVAVTRKPNVPWPRSRNGAPRQDCGSIPKKTRIVDVTQRGGFDFLGYHFERGLRWPSTKSLRKIQDKIRAKTRRTNRHSLQRIISELVPIQRGWFEYFKHSHWSIFEKLDKWIRMRLRSILRHYQKRKGRSRGLDYNRWPNAFFAKQGLYSFMAAHAQAVNPLRGKTTNRRAGCGRSARPVRREGGPGT
jgi:RNA-directed DNA polymerase